MLILTTQIHVDEGRQTVILPIYGYATPFHISTIKNVTETEEQDHTVLRIMFQSPGQIAGKKEDMVRAHQLISSLWLIFYSLSKTPTQPLSAQHRSGRRINGTCRRFSKR